MARSTNPNGNTQKQTNILLIILFGILRIFIFIGDTVRYVIRWIILLPFEILDSFFFVIDKAVQFLQKAISTQKAVGTKKNPGRPPKIQTKTKTIRWDISLGLLLTQKRKEVGHMFTDSANWIKKTVQALSNKQKYLSAKKAFITKQKYIKEHELAKTTQKTTRSTWKIPVIHLFRFQTNKQTTQPLQYNKLESVKSFLTGVIVTIVLLFIPYASFQWLGALPNPQLLSKRDIAVTTKIFDRHGALLYEIYTDENRTPIPLSDIPQVVKEATIAIEDKDFYRHQGISISGIVRSIREIILNNRIQGGSTITQQLIKSALLTPEVKITRKIKEIILAFWAERLYDKNQILEMYLNQVPYGGTAWGAEAASQMYFGKSVMKLNLPEAALLAGLPAAPTEYSPFGSHPEKALERQREVLRRMSEDRYITKQEYDDALIYPLVFVQPRSAIRAPHFVMYVKNLLENKYGPRLVEQGGLRIVTSLDIKIQEKAEEIVKNNIDSLARMQVGNGAAMVTNPKTGEILAMVGSKDYFDIEHEGNVNVTTSLRQPGSSIKVVNYAAALENGFTAASIIDDSPVIYKTVGSPPYAPVNYDSKFHGPTALRYALANSYNIPAVKVLAKIGIQTMIEKGKRMGITTWEDESRYGLSLTLGGGDVMMTDMMKVFGTLANQGIRMDLMPVLEVTDYTGRVIEKNTPKNGIPAVKTEIAWILSNMLSDNTARTPAFGPNSSLVITGKTVSVKTGTSNDKRDNWTLGYTPSYVVGVWVGNNDNSPMNPHLTSGITGASPIWHDIMTELLKNKADEIPPKPLTIISSPCYFGRIEYFMIGTEPTSGRCGPLPSATPSASLHL